MDTEPQLHPRWTRRAVLGGGLSSCLGLAACGASPTLDLLGSALTGLGDIGKVPSYGFSTAQIDALPYASLGLRIGHAAPAVMILASIDGEDLHWASADRVVFVTRRGRLIKTVGLPRDLVDTQWTVQDPLAGLPLTPITTREPRVYRFVDLRPADDFGVPVQSGFEVIGEETITILGRSHETLRIRERVDVRKWRWSTENLFWADKITGRVWRSRQQFCPDVAPMVMELLKPAAESPARA